MPDALAKVAQARLAQLQRLLHSAQEGLNHTLRVVRNAMDVHHDTVADTTHVQGEPSRMFKVVHRHFSEAAETIRILAEVLPKLSQQAKPLATTIEEAVALVAELQKVAYSTHLAALNATAAASRAGQDGAAFGVVAQETASLPELTNGLSNELRALIERSETQLKQALQSLEHSAELGRAAEALAHGQAQRFRDIGQTQDKKVASVLEAAAENRRVMQADIEAALGYLSQLESLDAEFTRALTSIS